MKRTWYEFKASARPDETEVLLYNEIGGFGVSAAQFVADLQQVPPANRLVLRIHSPGGSVLDGNVIANALKAHPGGVTTQIDGLAASMASVVALVGKPCRMAANAFVMIHNVSTYAEGDAEDLRRQADVTEMIQEGIVKAYAQRTGLAQKKVRDMMNAETWMDAATAKDLGFVDEIGDAQKMSGHFDLSKFRNAPPAMRFDTPEATMKLTAQLAIFLATASGLRVTENSAEPEIKAAIDKVIANLAAAQEQARVNFADLTTARAELATANNTIATLRTDLATLTTERNTARADLQSEKDTFETRADTRIEPEVIRRCGAAGIPPVKREPKLAGAGATETVPGTMTRAEFKALTPRQQSEFCQAGGNITD